MRRKIFFNRLPKIDSAKAQSGQALVEYILLLVVIVGVCLGLSTKFFKPAQKWADFYLGTYTQCLLDSGTLPGIAGGNAPTECDALSMAAGYDPKAGVDGQGANSANGGANSTSSDSKGGSGQNQKGQGALRARIGGSQSASNSSRGRGGRGGGGGPSDASNQQRGGDVSSQDASTRVKSRNRGPMMIADHGNPTYNLPTTKVRVVGISGILDPDKPKLETMEEKLAKDHQEESGRLKPKRLLIKKVDRKIASADGSSDTYSFGDLIRIGIILIIVVAIIYVVSTQVNSVLKGME